MRHTLPEGLATVEIVDLRTARHEDTCEGARFMGAAAIALYERALTLAVPRELASFYVHGGCLPSDTGTIPGPAYLDVAGFRALLGTDPLDPEGYKALRAERDRASRRAARRRLTEVRLDAPTLHAQMWAWTLPCPGCGTTNLHHGTVEVYNRQREDGEDTLHAVVLHNNVHVDRDGHGNPSRRRSGLRITFECELCDAKPVLDLVQHKGETIVCMYDRGHGRFDAVDAVRPHY